MNLGRILPAVSFFPPLGSRFISAGLVATIAYISSKRLRLIIGVDPGAVSSGLAVSLDTWLFLVGHCSIPDIYLSFFHSSHYGALCRPAQLSSFPSLLGPIDVAGSVGYPTSGSIPRLLACFV